MVSGLFSLPLEVHKRTGRLRNIFALKLKGRWLSQQARSVIFGNGEFRFFFTQVFWYFLSERVQIMSFFVFFWSLVYRHRVENMQVFGVIFSVL